MKKNACIAAFFHVLIPWLLFAQPYPTKPINIMVGFAPGGSIDATTRILITKSEKFMGQPFSISNNGGGGGSVALGIVAKEKPDGYHLAACTSTGLTLIPQIRAVPYKLDDFVPIVHFGSMRTGLVVRADAPWKTFKELVNYARTNPQAVTYGTAGAGTTVHLAMEYVGKQEKVQFTHVPYTGSLPAVMALLGSHITAVSSDTVWLPQVREGKLRLLVTYEEKRMKAFPEVPTLKELGYDFLNVTLFMVAAPRGTPRPIVLKLNDVFHKAMDDPGFVQGIENLQYEVATYRNPEDLKKELEETHARLQKIITELNIAREVGRK